MRALPIGGLALLLGCALAASEPESPSPGPLKSAAALAALHRSSVVTGDHGCPAVTAGLGRSPGARYYASRDGTGSGLSAEAPASLEDALGGLGAGDTVVLLPGNYGHLAWPAGLDGKEGAPITLRALHPAVTITGEPPDLVATPVAADRRTSLALTLHDVHHVRIEGIYGRIEVEDGGPIELVRNHHFENEVVNMQLVDVDSVSVHHSLFQNYRLKPGSGEDWHTDYGIAAYIQTRLAVHHNVFGGGFNHAISLKERSHDVTISCNRFVNCGRHCLELGQQTDGRKAGEEPFDRTSSRVLVENNLIEKTDDRLVNADFAVMIMNADDVAVARNRFAGFDDALLVSSYGAPSYCADLGETMSQVGIEPDFVRLSDNSFVGATTLRFTGRGIAGDRIEIGDVEGGPVECRLRTLPPITCDAACCRWDPPFATDAAPTIAVLDHSLACMAETR